MIAAELLRPGAKLYAQDLHRAGFFVRVHKPADKSLDVEFAILRVGENSYIWSSITSLQEVKEIEI
jgi:hypothetical protein